MPNAVRKSARCFALLSMTGREEILYQINHENLSCEVLLKSGVVTLEQLLPHRWDE
jgi:hypothetical protein